MSLEAIFSLIRFILTRCSDLVPAISLVGSAGGMRTIGAAPAPAPGGGGGALRMAATGIEAFGSVGGLGAGGGADGIWPPEAAGGGGGGGGGGAAAGGASAGFLGAAAPPVAPILIRTNLVPGLTVLPSSISSSSMTPAQGDGTGTEVLSVSISQSTSSSVTASPAAFSHLRSPSVMDSAKAGQTTTLISSKKIEVVLMLLLACTVPGIVLKRD